MPDDKTPGVYIVEKNAFPSSAIAVPTAIPVFIGYTEKAERNGKGLKYFPTKISSMTEYAELFGAAFHPKFVIKRAAVSNAQMFKLNGEDIYIKHAENNELYFYNAIRFFYLNGGRDCYILSVGSYDDVRSRGISPDDYSGDTEKNIPNVFSILEKEWEPTLVLLPDVVALKDDKGVPAYYHLYVHVLDHCNKTQSRFAIFDVARSADTAKHDAIDLFRNSIGSNALKYGAAYYPWLKTSVMDDTEINYTNLEDEYTTLDGLIPAGETEARAIVESLKNTSATTQKENHQSLMSVSSTYKQIMAALKSSVNLLPPGAAMAGIYTLVDTSRGVWKSPANVSVSNVNAPEVIISNEEQQSMNVDPVSGKSINIIRAFPGIGTLVWGGRTLDGNSQDWRYINVRRTLIMIEQSLKLATRAYVFEPNDSGTWITLQSMINNFLYNLWKQGALPGYTPEQAYSVQVGLGVTMTPDDILDNVLRITVLIAIVRPAEFIEITFQQQQQRP
ncbi:MAG: phage tail sheath C-terminal domain-containing protein [Ferruginibacter sp.]